MICLSSAGSLIQSEVLEFFHTRRENCRFRTKKPKSLLPKKYAQTKARRTVEGTSPDGRMHRQVNKSPTRHHEKLTMHQPGQLCYTTLSLPRKQHNQPNSFSALLPAVEPTPITSDSLTHGKACTGLKFKLLRSRHAVASHNQCDGPVENQIPNQAPSGSETQGANEREIS